MKKIAIQGIEGSNHHIVANAFFNKDILLDKCMSFDSLVDSVMSKTSDSAVMAIENSIAGSIIPNYALIDANNLHIIGEYYLKISMNFMALQGQSIEDIREVYSHPMALLQCKKYFKSLPHIKLIEDKDTAEVAKRIQNNKLKGVAALASKEAAEIFNLNILAADVQTIQNNATRFVIVQTSNSAIPLKEINKASLKFQLNHKRGSLASVLNVLSDCKLNLTKIQSLPRIETPWKYSFFVDVTFDDYKNFAKAKSILTIMAEDLKVLGEYKNGNV
ncbi:prephenate dehydratase [Tenacibaculum geojense]|uniref:prephenate dehydratase n=1 Tax=Tenacibaculum geojense TaxID=915352 RepID=A0ABW3JU19_9FLAO